MKLAPACRQYVTSGQPICIDWLQGCVLSTYSLVWKHWPITFAYDSLNNVTRQSMDPAYDNMLTVKWSCSGARYTYWDTAGCSSGPQDIYVVNVELSWCDRRSVDPPVLVSGTPLRPMTRFFFLLSFAGQLLWSFILGRPLWREDGSVICSSICQWSESRRTRNLTLLSHLRLLGSLSAASYDSQGLRWKYSNPPSHGE
jgi:hypothetical protein